MLEASLLDDARFLEELAKIEALPPEDTSVFPKPVPTVGGNQPPTAITDESAARARTAHQRTAVRSGPAAEQTPSVDLSELEPVGRSRP